MKEKTHSTEKSPALKKTTRTRKSNSKQNQREQIIYTATRLFREKGYDKTSISEIARQIDMDQSSIYYWFPSKEAIFESIYDPGRALSILERIQNDIGDRVVQLYMLIVYDVMRKCELPFDFVELEGLVHDHPERYEDFLKGYREYYHAFESVITSGIEEGAFNDCLVDEQVVTILSINEGLQHHYRAKLRNKLILNSCDYAVKDHSPDAIGHMAARTIMPGMLSTPQDIDDIRNRATEILEGLGVRVDELESRDPTVAQSK